MKMLLGAAVLCCALALPLAAMADEEQVPTEQEIQQAEGIPPVMPHAAPPLKGGSEEAACLACHEEGKKGAPQTPHAERRACTQCHVQGEIKAKAKKKGKKK
jgi:nitrate reductase cytochrome c-type subunit